MMLIVPRVDCKLLLLLLLMLLSNELICVGCC